MPKNISSEKWEEGMILAQSVTNKLGQIILPQNTVLTNELIRKLKIWGVKNIIITSELSINQEPEIPNKDIFLNKSKDYISKLIKWKPQNQYEQEIIDFAVHSYYKKLIDR